MREAQGTATASKGVPKECRLVGGTSEQPSACTQKPSRFTAPRSPQQGAGRPKTSTGSLSRDIACGTELPPPPSRPEHDRPCGDLVSCVARQSLEGVSERGRQCQKSHMASGTPLSSTWKAVGKFEPFGQIRAPTWRGGEPRLWLVPHVAAAALPRDPPG